MGTWLLGTPSITIRATHGHGKELDLAGYEERVRQSRAPCPDQRFDLRELIADGDAVVTTRSWSGTHIEFNPSKSINCQARSCALFVALMKNKLLQEAGASPEAFIDVISRFDYRPQLRSEIAQNRLL